MKKKCLLKKNQSPRATASWISGSSKQTGTESNTLQLKILLHTLHLPQKSLVITVEIRDATTDETPDATSTGIPTSEGTKLQCNLC